MLLIKNKKAYRNYEVVEKYIAGIALKGYEVKALREGNASFEGAYVKLLNGIPYITNLNIGKYSKQSQEIEKTDPIRPRELLLNKKEIYKITKDLQEKGKTAVPLAFLLKNNLVKLEIAVVKGRKKHEMKVVEKEKQIKKDLETFNAIERKDSWDRVKPLPHN